MTKGFAMYHDKIWLIYFFCAKSHAKNDFLKDVEGRECKEKKLGYGMNINI